MLLLLALLLPLLAVSGTTYALAPLLPPIPATECCVGALKVVTDSSHTFTPGTTAHNAAGVTTTYASLSVIPTAGVTV